MAKMKQNNQSHDSFTHQPQALFEHINHSAFDVYPTNNAQNRYKRNLHHRLPPPLLLLPNMNSVRSLQWIFLVILLVNSGVIGHVSDESDGVSSHNSLVLTPPSSSSPGNGANSGGSSNDNGGTVENGGVAPLSPPVSSGGLELLLPRKGFPFIDRASSPNVTALLGKTAYLNCRVRNLGDKTANYYRFAISWARILPNGTKDNVNEAGVQYYNNLINELLANGIQPMVTLYHSDLPQALQDMGGWLNEDLITHFHDYARVAFERFGDRVKTWVTFNEPWVICIPSYDLGVAAPGIVEPAEGPYKCTHTILKAHTMAWRMYDQQFRTFQQGKLGITLNTNWYEPEDVDNVEHRNAAERALQFSVSWIRHRDIHLLTVGRYTYTTDQRFRALHQPNSEDYTLMIKYPQHRDSGIYECQISTTPHSSHYVHLSVVEPVTEVVGGPDLFIDRGSTINLTCTVKFSPEPPTYIIWNHNNAIISYSSPRGGVSVLTEKGETTTSYLLIQQARPTDSGRYSCNPSNAASHSINVHVLLGEQPAAMQTGGQMPQQIPLSLCLLSSITLVYVVS